LISLILAMLSSMRLARTLTRTERLELLTRSAKFSTATEQQRLVVAVGGNALQRRGERLTIENQLKAAMEAAPTLKKLAMSHELILTHGNGPQVGELALERSAATFDVLGAESQGQIGYILSQAMASVGLPAAAIVTQVRVDPLDQAFSNPTKFVGPVYGAKESEALATQLDWTVKADGEYFRRVVPSPPPLQIMQMNAIKALVEGCGPPPMKVLPIACGGGGVPVAYQKDPHTGLQVTAL
jgi:carbamate kinase